MARAKKIGVDYYSHDVGAQKKQTVKALRSRFGNDGYAFWFILLELLGERDGLYMDCSDEATWIYLCTEVMIDEERVTEMLNFLGRLGAIDKDLWAVDKIIWCQNFTDRLAGVFEKRKLTKPEKPNSKKVSATEMPISAPVMQQSKVKESKVKESKVNTTLEVDTAPVDNSDNGSVDGTVFNNNFNQETETEIKVTQGEKVVNDIWAALKSVYPRHRGISVPMAKDALRKFLERGGDRNDLIAAAVKYGRSVAENKLDEQFMKTPHVFIAGYFKSFVPKYRCDCPECKGSGFTKGAGDTMTECCCVDRYKEWKV